MVWVRVGFGYVLLRLLLLSLLFFLTMVRRKNSPCGQESGEKYVGKQRAYIEGLQKR